MARNQKPYSASSTYGWTQMSPDNLAGRLQYAAAHIGNLRKKLEFDALAFTGSSGACIAFTMSVALNIPIIYVRKEDEKAHGQAIECNSTRRIHKYLIVDDFIASGVTVKRIHAGIELDAKEKSLKAPTCVGIYLYDSTGTDKFKIFNERTRVPIYHQRDR
jgi:orotate phosphoribosyltransferase-like protein